MKEVLKNKGRKEGRKVKICGGKEQTTEN
jgi:hypothetical protein